MLEYFNVSGDFMEELKNISIEDTGLFLTRKPSSIYKIIKENNINNVYELLNNYELIYNLLSNKNWNYYHEEFINVIRLLEYKYLNKDLDYDLDDNFEDCITKVKRSWIPIEKKLQSYGILKQVTHNYAVWIFVNHAYNLKVLDVINDISERNTIGYCDDSYNYKLLEVAKNRTSILLEYYERKNDKKLVKNKK